MFGWLVFIFLWNICIAGNFPVCTGVNINVIHYENNVSRNIVFNYSIDININLDKSFSDRNELIFSNFTYSSINETTYNYSNSTFCVGFNMHNSCLKWIQSSNSTITQEFLFHQYDYVNKIFIGNDTRYDRITLTFDKKMIFQFKYGYFAFPPDDKCFNGSRDGTTSKLLICCNNYVYHTTPDTEENHCQEYQTKVKSFDFTFEANFSVIDYEIKIDGNKMSGYYNYYYNSDTHDYNTYTFAVTCGHYDDYNDCGVKGNNSCQCYIDLYPENLICDVQLILWAHASFYSVFPSKFRVVNNGIILNEDFEAFTPSDPCWIAPTLIAGEENSETLNASFCCTKFGPPKTVKPITCDPSGRQTPRTFAYVTTTPSVLANTISSGSVKTFSFPSYVCFIIVYFVFKNFS